MILSDFTVKSAKLGREICTENQSSRNKMRCAADNYNNMCHICAKELLDLNFN